MKKILLSLCLFLFFTASALAAVNINTADQTTLESIHNVGPAKAQAIIDYRTTHGKFNSVDELTHVKGFGEKTLEKIKDQLTVAD